MNTDILPANEKERLQALWEYQILNTPPEQEYDDIVQLASLICQTPIALISLVDDKRAWFKSKIGISAEETSRDVAFCAQGILRPNEIMEIPDIPNDLRFAKHPLVRHDPPIRFYAGTPLVTSDGYAVGTLCVLDWQRRELTSDQRAALWALARQTMAQMELRRRIRKKDELEQVLVKADLRLRQQNRTLMELATSLESAYQDLDHVLRDITEAAARTFEVARVSVWMFDPARTKIQCRDLFELEAKRHSHGMELKGSDYPAYFEALNQSRVISAHDAHHDPRTSEFSATYLTPLGIQSMLDVPIRSGGRIAGVLCHEQIGEPRFWSGEEEGFARSLADLVSLAMEMRKHEQAEAQAARARDAALAATRAKSEFLANMSHEIRTPMNGIVGMTSALGTTELNPQQREMVDTIQGCADSLLTIISDILDFSKIEAGKLKFERIDFDLRGLIEEVGDVLSEQAFAKGLELLLWVEPVVPSAVRGDPTRLRQVLLNLVGNAIKFTEHGEVIVHLTAIRLSSRRVTIRCEVADTGIGIQPEAHPHLFTSFSQGDGSTTRTHGGTGLGLAISKRLVAMMGGDIWLESLPGKGSTFWFTADLECQPRPAGPGAAPLNLSGRQALVVDDHASTRQILRRLLTHWHVTTREAACGQEALALLKAQHTSGAPFDFVLLDEQMPEMDGITLIRAIRQEPDLAGLRLVLLTSHHAVVEPPVGEMVDLTLAKPVRETRLQTWLQETFTTGPTPKPSPAAPPPPPGHRSLRILVAEDNRINQRVALLNLERLGLSADLAANGQEALEALQRQPYDVVLMDCQMPVMDGFEATTAIRKLEVGRPGTRTRIVAMTASAMEGDRDRCLAAGMDDYISKPVVVEDLERILLTAPHHPPAPIVPDTDVSPPVDLSVLQKTTHRNPQQMRELADLYVELTTEEIKQLEQALAGHAPDQVRHWAHQCAGSSASLGVQAMIPIMRELEKIAHHDHLPQAPPLLDRAKSILEDVRQFFHDHLGKPDPKP